MKQICPTHHFAYSGRLCPFCEKERLENLSSRFSKKQEPVKVEKEREVTDDDLQRLMSKFNKR